MSSITISKSAYSFNKYLNTSFVVDILLVAGSYSYEQTKSLLSWSSRSSGYVFKNVNAERMLICQRLFAKSSKE